MSSRSISHQRIPTEYHSQDWSDWCGPTAAQIVLRAFGEDCSAADQRPLADLLFDSRREGSRDLWRCSPLDLEVVLSLLVFKSASHYQWHGLPSGQASRTHVITGFLSTLLAGGPVPVAVYDLVNTEPRADHWVVVDGLAGLNLEPTTWRSGCQVTGIWFRNPDFEGKTLVHCPKDHCPNDGRKEIETFVTVDEWFDKYHIGATYQDSVQLIWVGAPPLEIPLEIARSASHGSRLELSPEQAAPLVAAFIADYALSKDAGGPLPNLTHLGKERPGVTLGTAGEFEVSRFDLLDETERAVGLVEVSPGPIVAALHLYRQPVPSPLMDFKSARVAALDHLLGSELGLALGETDLERRLSSPDDGALYWQPCPFSWSSALPFYRFRLDPGPHESDPRLPPTVFVRVDGMVSDSLGFHRD